MNGSIKKSSKLPLRGILVATIGIFVCSCSTVTQEIGPAYRQGTAKDFMSRWDAAEKAYGKPHEEFRKLYAQSLKEVVIAQAQAQKIKEQEDGRSR